MPEYANLGRFRLLPGNRKSELSGYRKRARGKGGLENLDIPDRYAHPEARRNSGEVWTGGSSSRSRTDRARDRWGEDARIRCGARDERGGQWHCRLLPWLAAMAFSFIIGYTGYHYLLHTILSNCRVAPAYG